MQTEKKVFQKLFATDKVELKSQKVELNIVDDAEKIISEYYNVSNTAYSKTTASINSLRDALETHKKSLTAANKFDASINKINQLAKEIGIDPKNISVLNDLKIGVQEYKRTLENIKLIEKAIATIS